jgi:plastocyanin
MKGLYAGVVAVVIIVVVAAASVALYRGGTSTSSSPIVNIQNYAFNPQSITVNVGTTITWKNLDSVDHTVTTLALDPIGQDSFDSGYILPGDNFQHTFENAGTYNYRCTIHGFTGTVIVQQPGGGTGGY